MIIKKTYLSYVLLKKTLTQLANTKYFIKINI